MYRQLAPRNVAPILASIAVLFATFAGVVAARDRVVTASVHVSTRGFDLNRPSDAHAFYRRLQQAAQIVCTSGDRLALEHLPDPQSCADQALGNAIRAANVPTLTEIYVATHTLQEAAARGIAVNGR